MGCVFPLTTPCCDGVCFYTEPHFVFGHLINSYKPKSQLLTICAIFRISCHIQCILANEVAKYVLSKPDHFDGQPKKKSPIVFCAIQCVDRVPKYRHQQFHTRALVSMVRYANSVATITQT